MVYADPADMSVPAKSLIDYLLSQIPVPPVKIETKGPTKVKLRPVEQTLGFSEMGWFVQVSWEPSVKLFGKGDDIFDQPWFPGGFALGGGFYPLYGK
jgi:hypothetical protein